MPVFLILFDPWKQESSDVISYTWIYPWKLKIWNDFFHRNHLELCVKFKRWLRKGFKPNKLSLRGLQIWWKWKVRRLLESVNGKRQQVFPFFDCISYKLLRIGPVLSPPCDFQFHFFFSSMFICFLMKMIYINNKHCEESTDAVCCRITWKNNDERRQALMRHLELHIKRQPGVFLHSLGNWCLSLMPCASLKGSRLWFGCQMGRFFFFFFLIFSCVWYFAFF